MEHGDIHRRHILWLAIGGIVVVLVALAAAVFLVTRKDAVPATPIVTLHTPAVQPSFVRSGFNAPTAIVAPPDVSDKRLFVVEQAGQIRSFTPSDQAEPQAFLDIRQKVLSGGEMGLLGLAFHPNYRQNGYVYVNYIDKGQNTVIARYHVPSQAGAVDTASEKVLLTLKQPYTNHNGGDVVFGPDGYLYVALGDGGSGGDPENRAQNKDSLLGKILRLDVDKGDPYGIPPTNPFVGQAGTRPEIWAYGLRNPWRISFDKSTGDLYIADVGQGSIEEINVQRAASKGGENYGWRCFEGTHAFKLDGCGDATQYVQPVVEYNHDEGRCSVTGGYVYRGSKNPALVGNYFYGDYCNGQLFYASQADGKWTQTLAAKTPYSISTFGQGSDGEVYFADYKTGSLYRLEDAAN